VAHGLRFLSGLECKDSCGIADGVQRAMQPRITQLLVIQCLPYLVSLGCAEVGNDCFPGRGIDCVFAPRHECNQEVQQTLQPSGWDPRARLCYRIRYHSLAVHSSFYLFIPVLVRVLESCDQQLQQQKHETRLQRLE
jgi:hypothetical protein